ncbi:FAD-dependent pyridine nucleotide-disulfide oxidoreductase [Arcobacter nitrofigilis DSM 7299]|uniref:Dihydrolipoyl dehydrogenase n=1 Tax=Arcobacter nitrofigilis (strain ATCC 33309 / DSM 7299 / CCUG 15893 / LMG 7604 / NCTC 12251 / CI) TaxID=572480 RepID=D5V036_ARCNC|nr:dihydrolipoyl dehydrogenase [Arcobacter nitrofigilis]ADG93648.1 FAD-dependent pyridine nucleotide-disulfide oxidoreductase [Arcobacter nitrofigilis DSM 7299]
MKKFDLIIIGAGRASNLAVTAGKAGKKVALIEKSTLGGTCPNRGCVPSKLLIGFAHVANAIKDSNRHFIDSTINKIDLEKIFQDTNEYISKVDEKYEHRFNENVEVFKGTGSFVSNNIVQVNEEQLTAPKIVIATGTKPKKPEHDKAWTSDDIFPLKGKIPKSLTIVGSGFIACELASFFSALGVETTLLARSQHILGKEDYEIQEVFKNEFSKKVNIEFNTSAKDVEYKNEHFSMTLENKDGTNKTHISEALLYAIGRESNTSSLKLENTSIQTTPKGYIKRDEFFETSAKGVYVVGEAAGVYMLQHAASYEVNHLGKILLEDCKEPLHFKYMPHAVFTEPEIASVGITEQEAKEKNIEYLATTTNWLASAKAMSTRLKYPITKFITNPKTYEILGCHMIGPESSTMIHQVLAVMHINNDIRHLKEMLYIHPAMSEALLPAAVTAVKEIEKYNK